MKAEYIVGTCFGITLLAILLYVLLVIITAILQNNIDKKHHVIIYKKKNKKYETKADPIYKIDKNNFQNLYRIVKWEMKWDEHKKFNWILCILLYPIDIYEWRYVQAGGVLIGDENKLRIMYAELEERKSTIGDRYENIKIGLKEQSDIKLQQTKELENIVTTCNKEFDENYE